MKNNRQEETIRAYFAREQVPEQVHQKLTETFRLLEERPVKKRRPVWKGVAVSFSTVAAAFVLLCGVNAVNPAFAESLPLVGEAFRLYNGERKLGVGSYVGTYDEIELVNAPAEEENAQGMGLTLNEAYSDGEFIHLSFTMGNVPEQVMDDLYYLYGDVTSQANGQALADTALVLYPQGDVLSGTVAIPVEGEPADGTVLEVTYQVTGLGRAFAGGGSQEELEGSFSGEASVTVDTSHNQRYDAFASDSEVQINWVESTPSYTKINYTIPYWGSTHSMPLGIAMLYLEDGTPLQRSIGEEENVGFVKTDGPEQEAETITHTAFFDGLPQGTEKVILRFFEDRSPTGTPPRERRRRCTTSLTIPWRSPPIRLGCWRRSPLTWPPAKPSPARPTWSMGCPLWPTPIGIRSSPFTGSCTPMTPRRQSWGSGHGMAWSPCRGCSRTGRPCTPWSMTRPAGSWM